jgi:hypothetical protein
VAVLATFALPSAHAATMTVSGTVAPVMGIAPGTEATSGTVDAQVTHEVRDGVTIVTVYPG